MVVHPSSPLHILMCITVQSPNLPTSRRPQHGESHACLLQKTYLISSSATFFLRNFFNCSLYFGDIDRFVVDDNDIAQYSSGFAEFILVAGYEIKGLHF